jgi:hypothetical protein
MSIFYIIGEIPMKKLLGFSAVALLLTATTAFAAPNGVHSALAACCDLMAACCHAACCG